MGLIAAACKMAGFDTVWVEQLKKKNSHTDFSLFTSDRIVMTNTSVINFTLNKD